MSNYPNNPDMPSLPEERSYATQKSEKTSLNDELETLKREVEVLRNVVEHIADIMNTWMLIERPEYGDHIIIPP